MKKFIYAVALMFAATVSANAATVVDVTSSETAGLPGFTTYLLSATTDQVGIDGFDLRFEGDMNQVLFNNVLGGIFSDDTLFLLDPNAAAQDSYFTVGATGKLTIGPAESDSSLAAAIAQLDAGQTLQFAQIVAPTDAEVIFSGTITETTSGGFADAQVQGILGIVPEPTTALLAVLGLVGFAARRRV